ARATSLISASFAFRLISLPLALGSLVFGCRDQLSLDEAGLLDAVAFVIGGQQEGAIPQGLKPAGGAPFTNERSSTNQSGHMPASAKPMIHIATAAACGLA